MLHRTRSQDLDLAYVQSPDGQLERATDGTLWSLPRTIELRRDRICWTPEPGREILPGRRMLTAFMGLGDKPAEAVLGFAKKYGVLGLCEHDVPASGHGDCVARGWRTPQCWEPVEVWHMFAREALALTRIAGRLLQGQTGRAEDWQVVYGRTKRNGERIPWWQQHLDVERVKVAMVANEWLSLGRVRPVVDWRHSHKKPSVRLGGHGLFGALALQLALAVGQSPGFAICVHCRQEYPPTARRPKAGQRNFCLDCRAAGIPRQYSLRDFRDRQRLATRPTV